MATQGEVLGILRLRGGDAFVKEVQSRARKATDALANIGTALRGAGFALFVRQVTQAAGVQEQAAAKIRAAIESTGGAAGFTAAELEKMAGSLQEVGIFGDEAIMGVQSLMLTFTKVNREVFPKAIELALDMSAALDQDLKSSAIQVGKALNDPIQGMMALGRTGIQFTEQQREQVKVLQESGDLLGAQNIIIQELATQFGGMNRALAQTDAGKIKQVANAVGDLQEKIGAVIGRALMPLISGLRSALTAFGNLSQGMQEFTVIAGLVAAAMWVIRAALVALFPALGPVGWLVTGLTLAAGAFGLLRTKTEESTDALRKLRGEFAKLTEEQLFSRRDQIEQDLKFLQEQERRVEGIRFRALTNQASDQELAWLKEQAANNQRRKMRLQELTAEHALIQEQIRKHEQAKAAAAIETQKQLSEEEKKLLDNRMEFEFQQGVISRERYVAHLRSQLADFQQYSDEWIRLQKTLMEQEKLLATERQAEQARIAQAELELRTTLAEMSPEEKAAWSARIAWMDRRLQELQDLVHEKMMFIAGGVRDAAFAISDAFNEAGRRIDKMKFKDVFREILLVVLEFIERYFILAKIKTIIDGITNPFLALKNAAPLLAALAAINLAKAQIMSFAEGGIVAAPTLALVGDSRRGPEIIAPQQDFMAHSERLIDAALNGWGGQGGRGVTIVQNFNTPLNDRRQAERLKDEALIPELRRERRREEMFLNRGVVR